MGARRGLVWAALGVGGACSALISACGDAKRSNENEMDAGHAPAPSSGEGGDLSPPPPVPTDVVSQGNSWDVRATVDIANTEAVGGASCTAISFTLNLAPDHQSITTGRDGYSSQARLSRLGNQYTPLPVLDFPVTPDCPRFWTAKIDSLIVREDTDASGKSQSLTGSATGTIVALDGNVRQSSAIFQLTGTPDITSPTLLIDDPGPRDPLEPVHVRASEPLAKGAVLFLGADGPALWPDDVHDLDGVVPVRSRFTNDNVLPFGGSWTLLGDGQDLGGRRVNFPTVRTWDDPGVVPDGSFEGQSSTGIHLNASTPFFASGRGTVPAILGQSSLWLEPEQKITFHLRRLATKAALVFYAQAFDREGFDSNRSLAFGAGVPGYPPTTGTFLESNPTAVLAATGDAAWPYAGIVERLSIPLNDPGEDVYLEFDLTSRSSALQIDDIHFE